MSSAKVSGPAVDVRLWLKGLQEVLYALGRHLGLIFEMSWHLAPA